MYLGRVHVYPDWELRHRAGKAREQVRWIAALGTILVSILLAAILRQLTLATVPAALLPEGTVVALYFLVGLDALATKTHRLLLVVAFPLLVAGILLSDSLVSAASQSRDPNLLALYICIIPLVILIPAGVLTIWVLFRDHRDIARRLPRAWWAVRVVVGIAMGCVVILILHVAQLFASLEIRYSVPQLASFSQRTLFALGLGSIGEELFYRGIVFRHLYRYRRHGFWMAALFTLVLNLPLYLILSPSFESPSRTALMLMAPCLMAIASCALYAWEGSTVASTMNNFVFRLVTVLMR